MGWISNALARAAEVDELRAELRLAKAEAGASELLLAAEKQDNARLQGAVRELEEMVSGAESDRQSANRTLYHAQHCYEQCEADRLALATERDEAYGLIRGLIAEGCYAFTDGKSVVCFHCESVRRPPPLSEVVHESDCPYVAARILLNQIDSAK